MMRIKYQFTTTYMYPRLNGNAQPSSLGVLFIKKLSMSKEMIKMFLEYTRATNVKQVLCLGSGIC
jgi:hypothetical protein